MVLGIRFPKQFEFSLMAATDGGTVVSNLTGNNGTPYLSGDTTSTIPIAPARYSAVRKVCFHASVKSPTGVSVPVRLRIMGVSSSPPTPTTITIAPGAFSRTTTWNPAFSTAQLFAKGGDFSSIAPPHSSAQITGPTILVTVTFDRFDASSADFFAFWDSITDPDAYAGFKVVLEMQSGTANSQTALWADVGVTVVQAPSAGNKSCTIVPMAPGPIADSVMQSAFTSGYRAGLFRYVAANWDHITQVNILTMAIWQTANARNFDIVLWDLTSREPTAQNELFRYNVTDTGGVSSGQVTLFRSDDVQSFLVDGADHGVLYENKNGGSNVTQPISWLEIIQEGFDRTECHHSGGNQFRIETTPTLYGSPATPPFDPTWYQSFPDDRILDRRLHIALSHVSTTIDTTVRLHIDADLDSDITGLSSTSTTIQGITPQQGSSPTATQGTKLQYVTGFHPDPIDLAGVRKMVFGIVIGTGAGTDDFIGTAHLVYALSVPTSEIPEIGDVFPLGEFNPEGCASTAAGLGDPGILVLTNGSTLPQKFNPQAGTIEDAGIPPPFCDEPLPSTQVDDTAVSPAGGLQADAIYRYRYTFRNCCTNKESDPNDADVVVDTTGASPAAQVTLNFTGVRIPGDPQICEICIYRTVADGAYPVMAKVGCFDPDSTSTFVDDLSDAELDFTNDELSTLNAPMPCVPIVVDFRNRLFGMGDIPDQSPAGTVSVVNGSDIVTGDGDVEWTRCLEGKYIQVAGCCRPFEIACVMPPEEGTSPALARLKLTEPYDCADATGKLYTICGRPNRLWFSEPFEPEYWPAINFIDVEPGDGDMLMGAVSNFDSLVICKRRKTYTLRFNDDPLTEVACPTRISSDIGCIAPRSFAQVASGSVWLADRGLALFDGRSVEMVPESVAFDVFFTDPDNPNYVRRDTTGRVIGAVGCFYPKRQQYLLLLPTVQTVRGANLMMVWDTQLRNITVYTFCQEFLSMTIGKDSDGNERVVLGDANGFVWYFDIGGNDGVGTPGATGTVTGNVTAAGIDPALGASYIEDSTASFLEGGLPGLAGLSGVAGLSGAFDGSDLALAGVCVFYRRKDAAPDDPWSQRVVYAATATRLFVTPSFTDDAPTDEFEYMLGPIDFLAKFKPTNYGDDDVLKRNWRQALVYEPAAVTSIVRVQLIPDFQNSDDEEGSVVAPDGTVGQGHTFDLSYSRGRQVRPVGRNLYNFEQVVLSNFAPDQPVAILNHLLMLDPHTSK